jgi:hypothetical protein
MATDILELEMELQTPACRADEARLRQLLAPDFVEIGASGRRWNLDGIVTMLRDESAGDGDEAVLPADVSARTLAQGVVQVFWESNKAGRRARRTSIWCERADGWRQVYHQGTLLP